MRYKMNAALQYNYLTNSRPIQDLWRNKMTKASNPFQAFDMSKFTADFDPSKFTANFSKMTKDMNIPSVDVDAVINTQQKNIEAITDVNQAATESLKAIAQRQTEILQETMKETQTAIDALTNSKTPQDATTAQIDFVKSAFETAFTNISELANMMASNNKDSMEKLNTRLSANIDEIQVMAVRIKN